MERPKHLIERSRLLRREATWPEKILWSKLRVSQLGGLKFRRQHPVLGHILDFACVAAKVGVELDGASHDDTRIFADERKQSVLETHGWLVVRVPNADLTKHIVPFLDHLLVVCNERIQNLKGL